MTIYRADYREYSHPHRRSPERSIAVVILTGLLILLSTLAAYAGDNHRSRSRIYGTVEELPADLNGTWIVDGRPITVTPQTEIDEEHGKAAVGAYVKAKGLYDGREFLATEVEIERGTRDLPDAAPERGTRHEFYGKITQLPAGGVGTWIIDDRQVYVDRRTRIDEKDGKAAVGMPVEVEGTLRGEIFHAREIEVKSNR